MDVYLISEGDEEWQRVVSVHHSEATARAAAVIERPIGADSVGPHAGQWIEQPQTSPVFHNLAGPTPIAGWIWIRVCGRTCPEPGHDYNPDWREVHRLTVQP